MNFIFTHNRLIDSHTTLRIISSLQITTRQYNKLLGCLYFRHIIIIPSSRNCCLYAFHCIVIIHSYQYKSNDTKTRTYSLMTKCKIWLLWTPTRCQCLINLQISSMDHSSYIYCYSL